MVQQKASNYTALKIVYMSGCFAIDKRLEKAKIWQIIKKSHVFNKLLGKSAIFIAVDIQAYVLAHHHNSFPSICRGTIL